MKTTKQLPATEPRYISQPQLIAVILKHLEKEGCNSLCQRHLNAVIQAAKDIVEALQKPMVLATPGMGIYAWLKSDDTGQSSKWLLKATTGIGVVSPDIHWPHDPDDFGRCVRLMEAVPIVRIELPDATGKHPIWDKLLDNWTELEALYREEWPTGNAPKLLKRMQELGC